MSNVNAFISTATIPMEEYDLLRMKAKGYDDLKRQVDFFNDILKSHMCCVLSRTVDHFFPEEDYTKKRKLNMPIIVNVDSKKWVDNNGIYSMDLQIEEPNKGGYYKASIITHYTKP